MDMRDDPTNKLYSVTELANEFEITPRAIRFYETKGLLSPQRAGSTRVYTYRDRARLMIILRGKRMGFSLAGIKEYFDLYDADPTKRTQMNALLGAVRARMTELDEQRKDLETTLDELRDVEKQTLEALEGATE